ncbi:hypothetical protein LJR231_003458 [Phyllobacterium sp. LjRoot231]|uniref:hypothetical protein n=1 Tax=Phyllobacterium sp. LjRoot231 TaxID=3342289 RepID=UPI003ECEBBBF
MGILDALFGGGSMMQMNPNAVAKPFGERLTSGMGSQGGLLGRMGLGDHPQQSGQASPSFGQPGGLLELLKGNRQGQRPMDQNYFPPAPQQGMGGAQNLQQLIQAFLAQNNRGG